MVDLLAQAQQQAPATSWVNVVSLVIGALGFALALASLTWQAATFVLSGTRLQCELRMGAVDPRGGGFVTSSVSTWKGLTPQLLSQGFTEPRAFVVVRNTGRLATSVTSYQLETNSGLVYGTTRPETWEKALPRRLEPGDRETWSFRGEDIQSLLETTAGLPSLRAKTGREGFRVWAVVEDGAGRKAKSKEVLRLQLPPAT